MPLFESGVRQPPQSEPASFSIDLSASELHGPACVVQLRKKLVVALTKFTEQAGKTVTREELLAAVWPERTASDESVTQLVSELRTKFAQAGARGDVIETMPKIGYRLVTPIAWQAGPSMQLAPAQIRGDTRFSARRIFAMTVAVALLAHAVYRHGPWF